MAEFRHLADQDEEGDHGRLLELRDAIHAFGESHGHTPGPPRTIAGMLEVEMFRLRLRQKEMAEELGIGASRLSEVLRGKRPAGIDLRRASYTKLHIPAEEVLLLGEAGYSRTNRTLSISREVERPYWSTGGTPFKPPPFC